ncbi:MAG: TRAP transporter substrate-binding protein [Sphaerochaeta sp.]|jgi:tripartite ATP-independent transporter DctP family solute receptor|nr:TRAP transporter substrate-binding protein [Sphaerochaeta sp.]
MKKIMLTVLMVALLVAPAFAQGGQEKGAAAQKQIVLRLADNQPIGYPTVVGDEEFARLVGEYTNGRIKIEVYPQGQLADEKSAIEQVQFGGIDFTRVSISPLASFQPLLNALQMPYLYRDANHMWNVLNGEIGQFFLDSMEEKGFVGLVYYDSGARSFYNTKKPIYTVADLRGMKIRVQESALMMGLVQALGAVPTPMAYGDVYSALQTGVIDGAENNWPSYDSSSHYEVAKFFSIDEHTRVPEMIIASKITMDKLSAEDQAIIKKAAKESQAKQVAAWAEYEKKSEAKVRAAGSQINKINNQAEFAAAMAPLYQSQLNDAQRSWVEKIKAVK